MELRDKLRAATVGAAIEYPSDQVEVGDDLYIEVRSLSFADKKKVQKAATDTTIDPNSGEVDVDFDQETYELELVLASCFEPGTDTLVFERGDVQQLKAQPAAANHWLAQIVDLATDLNKAGNLTTQNDSNSGE